MADNSILTPGYQDPSTPPTETPRTTQYLEKDNFLSEYASESERSVVRDNLNVPSKDSVYDKQTIDLEVGKRIRQAIQEYLNMDDPHGIIPIVEEMIENMVKTDGSTPFVAPQVGIDPIADNHLTTKKFVTRLLKEHINAEDPHEILPEVRDILEKYVKTSEIYSKSQLYTKEEINKKMEQYLKKDGSTPFTRAQVGADPTIDSHLTTKRYVDELLRRHLIDVDPHGFITILNQRLSSYVKKKDVFDKTQTYSRTQIDNIISQIVERTVQLSIQDYIDSIDDKFEYIRKQRYVKQDGSIPFRNPQSGVDAVEDSELVTLRQLVKAVKESEQKLDEKITDKECVWITSGPVESTVGHVEDNTPMPESMTLQEVCDAIFYGKGICLEVPEYVIITDSCPVTMCIHGSIGLVQYAELYQNGELIYTFEKEVFEDGCITVDSLPLFGDAEFKFKVYYTSGAVHEDVKLVKCYTPIFVGLLPKWKFANTITFDYLIELCKEDTEGTQNRFLNYKEDYVAEPKEGYGKDLKSITFKYSFVDPKLRHPFVVLPKDYPDLKSISINSQQFNLAAFDVIDQIPLQVPGVDHDIIYKIYVYRQALSRLDSEVTFNFTPRNE